jgi:hypothetical protein
VKAQLQHYQASLLLLLLLLQNVLTVSTTGMLVPSRFFTSASRSSLPNRSADMPPALQQAEVRQANILQHSWRAELLPSR